jgi:hypothetical protein
MFKRLLSRDVEEFAVGLALEFGKRIPPDAWRKGARPSVLAKAVDEVCNRAAEFQRTRGLGVYGKAKFGTAFKLQLKESGYPEEFVDELTQTLLIRISARREQPR